MFHAFIQHAALSWVQDALLKFELRNGLIFSRLEPND